MTFTPNLKFSSNDKVSSLTPGSNLAALLNNILAIYPVGAYSYIHQAPTAVETTLLGKWIQCNGAIVSRSTYSSLFAQFGNTDVYGGGDGSTTFGMPDLRGRHPVAHGGPSGHSDVTTFGNSEGAALASRRMAHAHTFANGSHAHSWSGTLDTAGAHTHTTPYPSTVSGSGAGSSGELRTGADTTAGTFGASANHTHSYTPTSVANTAVQLVGISSSPLDQPAYVVAGCWYIAYVN